MRHRFHLHEMVVQKAVREAVHRADIRTHATPHVFRHSFAMYGTGGRIARVFSGVAIRDWT